MTAKGTTSHNSLVEIFLKAKALEKEGHDVIHFDAGEPDFDPPKQVVEATAKALIEGKGRYTESSGILEARKSVSDHLSGKYSCNVKPSQILITSGGRIALFYSMSLLKRGSKVGIFSPDWPAYRDMCDFLSLRKHFFNSNLENNWEIDIEAVSRSNCDALVLNYPNNPTGKILRSSAFEELVQLANKKRMLVISDEVYSDYVLGKARFKSILETECSRYILVTSLSKSYAMTGYRAAYAVSDEATTSKLTNLNGMIMTSAPEFVQYAVKAAMQCDKYVSKNNDMVRNRLDVAVRALKRYLDVDFYIPDGSLYIFPKLRGTFDSEFFAKELLEKQFVSVTPGTSFGGPFGKHFRMTLLQDKRRIEEGIERMARLMR